MNSKSTIVRSAAAAAALLAVSAVSACGESAESTAATSGDSDVLTFAAVPAEASASLSSDFANIVALIEQETGKTVEFQNATDYAAVIEGQRAGKIDIASYGPFSYVIARDSGVSLDPLAAPTSDPDVAPAYTSLAYVREDSDISDLAGAKDRKVCFVDPASTSGYLVPTKGLLDVGLDPAADITPIMAGGHDASLLALESGQCDVAFAHDTMLNTLESEGQIQAGLKSIWESEKIPEDPIAVNTETVDPETVATIDEALRTMANKPALVTAGICESESDCELPEEIEWGYLPVDDSDYDPIRDICDVTKAEACQG
ncbi:phosphate/phosphite/phosphonate ABC transporter substrate-binding protein [Dietzia sp. E1]|uniref:phosphate/phosphite/phosphonate ABC transporter substrate-binding protein n=1 Tax=Dietzia sp. E1 TaxID=328361 RepID=UPI0015FAD9F2|nr:phosphate/phosphite/phosphonate ABC transporter substrate-binding protein [Dietzia sp. E1]MBB1020049.1 phosphate/phosphite/phosphonate ABC transporter substrate-binding protein [Dietzia sp. E1]